MEWSYSNPVPIQAGAALIGRVAEFLPSKGHILLVTTPGTTRRGLSSHVVSLLGDHRVTVFDQVTPNPDLDYLDQATVDFVGKEISTIIAIGGGSVIDSAKALSVTIPSGFPRPLNHVLRETSGDEWQTSIPVIAIPTTAGTGSEVTPFATVWDGQLKLKRSLDGKLLYPKMALLDPELTLSLPRSATLYSALDAISHSLESLWNRNRTVASTAFSIQALKLLISSLPAVLERPQDLLARAQLQQGSVLAGLAISHTRTALAHALSYPLTIHFGVPHGLACSFTLVELLKLCQHQVADVLGDDLTARTLDVLSSLNLDKELRQFADVEAVCALTMEAPDAKRAGNFILDINPLQVAELVEKSLSR